jgi:hypothetical protein
MQDQGPQTNQRAEVAPSQPANSAAAPATTTARPGAGRPIPLWLLTLAAGLAAGSLSWLGAEATRSAFPVQVVMTPEVAKMPRGQEKSEQLRQLLGHSRRDAERKMTVVAYGLLGALLGVALGLTGGWFAGSPRSGLGGVVGGGLTATFVGAALSWVLVPVLLRLQIAEEAAQYSRPDAPSRYFLLHCLFHAGICAGLGIATGVALGWGLGDRGSLGRALIGGLFGALAGVFLFETINSVAFPLLPADSPLPAERIPRLVMHLGVAAGAAFLAGLAAGAQPRRSTPTSWAG